jgi:N-acetylglutamate synthase-like GNAT family acetyltransferase
MYRPYRARGYVSQLSDGRIRRATREDIPAIARLVRRAYPDGNARFSEAEIGELLTRGEIIVLAVRPPELVAAACLTSQADDGRLVFLVVDPEVGDLDARIRSVATALGEARRTSAVPNNDQ